MRTIHARQLDTVDAIAWRYYGKTAGVVEAILQANAGLADKGSLLALGTTVILPDLSATDATTTKQLINLWD